MRKTALTFVILLLFAVLFAGCRTNLEREQSGGMETGAITDVSSRADRIVLKKREIPKRVVFVDKKKRVALTFDDGPHEEVTPRILDILEKHDARATFFVLGDRAKCYPEILRRTVSQGHEIGNHSWSHPHFTELTKYEIEEELKQTDKAIAAAVANSGFLVRPPYGEVDDDIVAVAGGPIISWSVDTNDWKSRNPQAILSEVQKQVEDGAIILMHDLYPTTAEALDKVLNWLNDEGYQVVTVSDLLDLEHEEVSGAAAEGKVFSSFKGS